MHLASSAAQLCNRCSELLVDMLELADPELEQSQPARFVREAIHRINNLVDHDDSQSDGTDHAPLVVLAACRAARHRTALSPVETVRAQTALRPARSASG